MEIVNGNRTSERVLQERAALDAEVEGMTVCHLLARNASEHARQPALSWKQDGRWNRLSWEDYRQAVVEVAMALRGLGVGRGDFVALMLRNRPEHVIADLAVVHAGATPVSIYNTSSPEQIAYIARDCNARVAIVEGGEVRARWEQVVPELPVLERLVVLGDRDGTSGPTRMTWDELVGRGRRRVKAAGHLADGMWRAVRPEDAATLVYTSGTTGEPKGVVITHRNVLWAAASFAAAFPGLPTGARYVSYLPLSHILERWLSIYFALWQRVWVHFCPDPFQVFEYLPDVRPHGFAGVPRVWEKLAAGIQLALASEPDRRKRAVAQRAVAAGVEAARIEAAGRNVPASLRWRRRLFDKLVYSKIRATVGLDRCRVAGAGAAPLSDETAIFFAGIGVSLCDGFGMTETAGQAICNRPGRQRVGTVGTPLPGVEVDLLPDGELLVRGPNVTPGYHGKPEETARAIDAEGWLHTGDLATVDGDGFVRIVDRKKELIITAGGKNVSPATLERLLRDHPLVGQACLVGDRRPYVTALVTLDLEVARAWATERGLLTADPTDLARHPRVREEIQTAVDRVNAKVSRHEQIKRFVVLPAEWTPLTGELTPSLKLKRRVVQERYVHAIDSMYAPVEDVA